MPSDTPYAERVRASHRGREACRSRLPCPENHWTPEQWRGELRPEQVEWLGWMAERALSYRQPRPRRAK